MLPKKYTPYIQIMSAYCKGFDEETGGKNYRYYHQLRTAESAYKIAQSEKVEEEIEEVAVIAGLFHDIGRIYILKQNGSTTLKYDRRELDKQKGHEKISKILVRELLEKNLSKEEIEKICDTITRTNNHASRSNENKILYDADLLDELGVLNLFRMFTYSGSTSRSLEETIDYWFETDRKVKLEKIETIFSPFAKKEALRRIKLQDEIMNELKNSGFSSN